VRGVVDMVWVLEIPVVVWGGIMPQRDRRERPPDPPW